MSLRVSITDSNQLTFEDYPAVSVPCFDAAQEVGCQLDVFDARTGTTKTVYFKEKNLEDIGVSTTVWNKVSYDVTELSAFLKKTIEINELLKRAIPMVSEHLKEEYREFFENVSFATRYITIAIHEKRTNLSGHKKAPGMQIYDKIFINLKGTELFGQGSFGRVRKVLWLNSPQGPQIVAKKVMKLCVSGGSSDFNGVEENLWQKETSALEQFSGKTGIISMIAAYDAHRECSKTYIYFPAYECNLQSYILYPKFKLSLEDKLSLTSQWLEGLATISGKGVHKDIKSDNLLLKRVDSGVEGVIADLGTYNDYADGVLENISIAAPPECFNDQRVPEKYDVWGMGIAIYVLFINSDVELRVPVQPDWVKSDGCNKDGIPDFIVDLVNDMRHPDPAKRLSADEALVRFRAGREAA